MLKTDPNYSWAMWQALSKRRNLCDKGGVHIINHDLTHACAHKENTSKTDILIKDNVFYKRCNLPLCPLKNEVYDQVAAID